MVPVLIEAYADQFGEFTVEWMVAPPEKGQRYIVTDDTWHEEYTIRRVHGWEPA